MACSTECLEFMEKCYRAQEYNPPVLAFDLMESIGKEIEVLRKIEFQRQEFKSVLDFFKSAQVWAKQRELDVEYQHAFAEECEDEFSGQFDKDDTYYFQNSFAKFWIQEVGLIQESWIWG